MSKLKQIFLGCLVFIAILMLSAQASLAANIDIPATISTQAKCTLEKSGERNDIRWTQGLNTEIDHTLLKGDVIAYKIRWFNGSWSDWYVTGVNDIDWKTYGNVMRRVWSYFDDHEHQYIICKEAGTNVNTPVKAPQLRVR